MLVVLKQQKANFGAQLQQAKDDVRKAQAQTTEANTAREAEAEASRLRAVGQIDPAVANEQLQQAIARADAAENKLAEAADAAPQADTGAAAALEEAAERLEEAVPTQGTD